MTNKNIEDIDDLDIGSHLKERLKKKVEPIADNRPDENSHKDQRIKEDFFTEKKEENTENGTSSSQVLEASFSTLVMSLGSNTLMALGWIKNSSTGKVSKDKKIAKFNIDLLRVLKEKTKGNLSKEEEQALDSIISDLQLKYIEA